MIYPDSITARFPEFSILSIPEIQGAIDEAVLALDESRWGRFYDMGLLYYSCHLLAPSIGDNARPTGPVTARAVDGVSVTFSNPGIPQRTFSGPHCDTWYGQRYDRYVEEHVGIEILVV